MNAISSSRPPLAVGVVRSREGGSARGVGSMMDMYECGIAVSSQVTTLGGSLLLRGRRLCAPAHLAARVDPFERYRTHHQTMGLHCLTNERFTQPPGQPHPKGAAAAGT